MTDIRFGIDWNDDNVIFWGASSVLDDVAVVPYNEYGLATDHGTVADVPAPVLNLAGTFTASGFDLSWEAGTATGEPATGIMIWYDDVVCGTASASGTSYTKTYDSVELLENITPYVMSVNWSLGLTKEDEVIPNEGNCTISLDNSDRTFSPANTASDLYGEMLPLRIIKLEIADSGGTWHRQWTGAVNQIQPYTTNRNLETKITGDQGIFYLRYSDYPKDIRYSKYTGENLDYITQWFNPPGVGAWRLGKDSLGYTTRLVAEEYRQIDTGSQLQTYFNEKWFVEKDRLENQKASKQGLDIIVENLALVEDGLVYLDQYNRFFFKTRSSLLTNAASATSLSIDDAAIRGNYIYTGIDMLKNIYRMTWYNKIHSDSGVIATNSDDRTCLPSASMTYEIDLTENNTTAISVDSFVFSTNHGNYTYTYDVADDFSTVSITFTCDPGGLGDGLSVTNIDVVGEYIRSAKQPLYIVTREDSVEQYGQLIADLELKELESENMASYMANRRLAITALPKGFFTSISLVDKNTEWLDVMLQHNLMDAFKITEHQTAETDRIGFILGENCTWQPGLFKKDYILSTLAFDSFWILGSAALGTGTMV